MSTPELSAEAERQLSLCNSCRYCEGYCAVFPAIEQQRSFNPDDVRYIANLCMDCRECYYACQYAPPHEFAINIPKILSEVREETYRESAWPRLPDGLVKSWFAIRAAIALVILALALVFALDGSADLFGTHTGPGAFYQVIPESVMVIAFLVFAAFWAVSWIVQAGRFWHQIAPGDKAVNGRHFLVGLWEAVTVRYLGGGGEGCTYPQEQDSTGRRWMHHFVLYGFLLDFASTTLAAIYDHIFHVPAPYPFFHPVVLLGTAGGIGIIIGTSALIVLKLRSDKDLTNWSILSQDVTFLTSLLLVGVTGMLLLAFRSSAAMGSLLALHLATVAAFFLTAPYSKFKHAMFRLMSLIRNSAQRVEGT